MIIPGLSFSHSCAKGISFGRTTFVQYCHQSIPLPSVRVSFPCFLSHFHSGLLPGLLRRPNRDMWVFNSHSWRSIGSNSSLSLLISSCAAALSDLFRVSRYDKVLSY